MKSVFLLLPLLLTEPVLAHNDVHGRGHRHGHGDYGHVHTHRAPRHNHCHKHRQQGYRHCHSHRHGGHGNGHHGQPWMHGHRPGHRHESFGLWFVF